MAGTESLLGPRKRRKIVRKLVFLSVTIVVCFAFGGRRLSETVDDGWKDPVKYDRHLLDVENPDDAGDFEPTEGYDDSELANGRGKAISTTTSSTTTTVSPHRKTVHTNEQELHPNHSKSNHDSPIHQKPEETEENNEEDTLQREEENTLQREGEDEEEKKEKILEPNGQTSKIASKSPGNTVSKQEERNKLRHVDLPSPTQNKSPAATSSEGYGSSSLTTSPSSEEAATVSTMEECTPPAYHEFPPDLFNEYQRSHGAVIIHILVIMYMFYAVAVVCDEYFIASLDECCNRLQLSEDVAGATFMAAGSSAPELFTAILGVLVAKGDVGTGTIVGSAVFNVLFVIGMCGICAGRVVELTWWPLFRDSSFYSLTVMILIIIIFDSEVTWYESLIMMSVYSLYIVIMKFNNDIHMWLSHRFGIEDDNASAALGILEQGDKKNYSSYVPFNNEIDDCAVSARFHQRPPADESIRDSRRNTRLSLYDAALQILMSHHFRPKTRFRAAAFRIMLEHERRRKEDSEWTAGNSKIQTQLSIDSADISKWKSAKSFSTTMGVSGESNWRRLPKWEEGFLSAIKWVLQVPLLAVLHYTIPDCRKDKWRKFFLLTFTMSITWTAVFSYVMVWMVTLVGYTLGIPDSIMGITFLAAGTSVPDAFASIIVARQGQGDMAVSNSIGSNVFDILIGLALPWFIQTAIVEPGSIAVINSRGMVYSVILLFLTILITLGGIYFSHWQLTPRLGFVLLGVYAFFLAISIALEFNLLGYVNPPMCAD